MANFIKTPCKHCPFRNDVKPYLHPERGEELAFLVQNPYNSFTCHKTTEYDEEMDDMCNTEESKECAGFLTLRAQELGEEAVLEIKEGFKPSYDIVYMDSMEMMHYYDQPDDWEHEFGSKKKEEDN